MNSVTGSAHYSFLLSSEITAPDRALEPQGFEYNRNKIISYSTYAGNVVETFHLPHVYI